MTDELSANRGGLATRTYLLALPAAAVAFIGLSIVDEWPVFRDALGWSDEEAAAPAVPDSALTAAVRAFAASVQAGYAQGSADVMDPVLATPEVIAEMAAEFSFTGRRPGGAPLQLDALTVLSITARGEGGWNVITDETWGPRGGTQGNRRLRYRYTLAPQGERLVVTQMRPVLPEPRPDDARP